uniref:Uncharacterized protein n=1 Tax=viral metagenome TaxID=1070528 RepID=A0A6C0LRR5_9ZZZZ
MNSVSDNSLVTTSTPLVNEEPEECNITNPAHVVILSFIITSIGVFIYYIFLY